VSSSRTEPEGVLRQGGYGSGRVLVGGEVNVDTLMSWQRALGTGSQQVTVGDSAMLKGSRGAI